MRKMQPEFGVICKILPQLRDTDPAGTEEEKFNQFSNLAGDIYFAGAGHLLFCFPWRKCKKLHCFAKLWGGGGYSLPWRLRAVFGLLFDLSPG